MHTEIPRRLRTTLLLDFIYALIFGLAGALAPKLVGDIAGHPVRDADVNMLMGVASLTFAVGYWYAYRATRWEQISILVVMNVFFGLVAGIGGSLAYFVPALFRIDQPLPPVQLLISLIELLFGIAYLYFYVQITGWRSPLAAAASAR